jgi:hypothetical protein
MHTHTHTHTHPRTRTSEHLVLLRRHQSEVEILFTQSTAQVAHAPVQAAAVQLGGVLQHHEVVLRCAGTHDTATHSALSHTGD